MRLVVDTNVFISGVFFSGPPYSILDAWRRGSIEIILFPEILVEYRETGEALGAKYPEVECAPWLELVTPHAHFVDAPSLPEQVCTDPDDDKFLACALASQTQLIISGDRALLATSGFRGVTVLTPRQFMDAYLA